LRRIWDAFKFGTVTIRSLIKLANEAKAARREVARAENSKIGSDDGKWPVAERFTLEDMLQRCVYVGKKKQVVVIPQQADGEGAGRVWSLSIDEFRGMVKASVEVSAPNEDGKRTRRAVVDKWEAHKARVTVLAATMALGRPRFIDDPEGNKAVNLWTPRTVAAPDGWRDLVQPFLEHVAYLVPVEEERERFLDWLAHMEQHPEVLPHHGYLMFTPAFGVGRNWLASVLARVWRGSVAASLNLAEVLTSNFNGQLSGKRLAIVDEIHLGENAREGQQMEARLRQILTQEERFIKQKYGLEMYEFNSCRFLLFSNHENALPMDREDRRFVVVANPTTARDGAYYEGLYGALGRPEFIDAVTTWLAARDLRGFKPGALPPMNAAKRAVIEATAPGVDGDIEMALEDWDSPVVAMADLGRILRVAGREISARQIELAMIRLGHKKHKSTLARGNWRVGAEAVSVWILKGRDLLKNTDGGELVKEYRSSEQFLTKVSGF
jgi:hypothetical protein